MIKLILVRGFGGLLSKIVIVSLIGLMFVNCYWKRITVLGYRTNSIYQNGLNWKIDVYDTYHQNSLRSGPYRISISCRSSKRNEMEAICLDSVILKNQYNDSVVDIIKLPPMKFMGGYGGYPLIKSVQLPNAYNLAPNDLFLLVYYSNSDSKTRKGNKITFLLKYFKGKKYSNEFIDGCLSI